MSKKKKLIIFLLLMLYTNPSISKDISADLIFLELKARDKIKEAFAIASKEFIHANTPFKGELWLFRLKEILRYPELFNDGIETLLTAMQQNSIISQLPRAKILLLELYLNQGKFKEAKNLFSQLGFIYELMVSLPIKVFNSNELEKTFNIENNIKNRILNNNNFFPITADISGKIDVSNVIPSVQGNAFVLYTDLIIPKDSTYTIFIGKNCPMVMAISGEKIFSDLTEHDFEYDQFHVHMKLEAGKYPVIIKTLGTKRGLKFTLRIIDQHDNCIKANRNNFSSIEKTPQEIINNYFYALQSIKFNVTDKDWLSFYAGYLHYAAKLTSSERNDALKYFQNLSNSHTLSPYANFYSSLCTQELLHKEQFLHKALSQKMDFIEALAHITELQIEKELFINAFSSINSMYAINPSSPLAAIQHGNLCFALKWYFEAQKIGEKLITSAFPSLGHQLLAKIYELNKNPLSSYEHYYKLYTLNKSDRFSLLKAVNALNEIGKYDTAENLLLAATSFFMNDVELYLKIAETVDKNYGATAALPYLSSAHALSPQNDKILSSLAQTYHRLGKDDVAKYYFTKTLEVNKKNTFIDNYTSFLFSSQTDTENNFSKQFLNSLVEESKKYEHEPAVILLDHTSYDVFSDGSKVKHVRIIYKINSHNAIKDLSHHTIILQPQYEALEKVKCLVIFNDDRIETSETKIQSLSDPESRLYYDSIAHTLTIPSLREGSYVDLTYTIKTKGSNEYKGVFGFITTLGGKHRVLHSSVNVLLPTNKKLYYEIKNHPSIKPTIETKHNKKLYAFTIKNIEPLFDEPHMPPHAEILPTIIASVFSNWDELFKWYNSLLRGREIPSPQMLHDLSRVIHPNDSPIEKVQKIFYFVTSRIRYVGFEFGIGSIQPRSAAETYASGMGDCKDIALVLVSLLRAAGIDARIALVRTLDYGEIDFSLPWIGTFNHAICYVNIGEELFLDGTASFSGFSEIPETVFGVKAFIINDKGYMFRHVHSPLFDANITEIKNTVSLQSDGSALIHRHLLKKGGLFAPHARYSLQDERSMINNITEYWNKEYIGSSINNFTIIQKNNDKPVEYSYTIKIPTFCQLFDNLMVFKSVLMPSEEFQNLALKKTRRYSLNINAPYSLREITVFNIPPNFKTLRIPSSTHLKNETIDINFNSSENQLTNTVIVEYYADISQKKINTNMYDDFRKILRLNSLLQNEKIILKKN